MNLIIELPKSIEPTSLWSLTCQIRDLVTIQSAVYMPCDNRRDNHNGEEIWIETVSGVDGNDQQQAATVALLTMLVRDWVADGAKIRLAGERVLKI